MKTLLTLTLGAALSLGLIPSQAEAAADPAHRDLSARVVVHTTTVRRDHHRRSHRVYHRAHWVYRHHHRVLIPARYVVVYY